MKRFILLSTVILLACSSQNDVEKAQMAIAGILKHAMIYQADKGEWPTRIEQLELLDIDEKINKCWLFKIQADSKRIINITAISTGKMTYGPGKIVMFNTIRGTWSGSALDCIDKKKKRK